MQYLGDDYVALRCGADGTFTCYSLYGMAKATDKTLALLPQLAGFSHQTRGPHDEKTIINAGLLMPILRKAIIKALVLCRVDDRAHHQFELVSAATIFREVISTNRVQLVGTFKMLSDVAAHATRTLPCYRLGLADDPLTAAGILRNFLEHAGA